ncbi:hypothetical protein [Streptomyces sp. CS014]|nr:hypothetical protein [Streptomyces sp. CS014]
MNREPVTPDLHEQWSEAQLEELLLGLAVLVDTLLPADVDSTPPKVQQ